MTRFITRALLGFIGLIAGNAVADALATPLHRYIHQQWSRESGLPHVSVHAVVQDIDSRIWLGTENGLARFDGAEFEDHTEALRQVSGSGWVTALARDSSGRVWAGTLNGVALIENGVLRKVPVPEQAAPVRVHDIAAGPDGGVCVGAEALWCTQDGVLLAENRWQGSVAALAAADGYLWVAGEGRLARMSVRGPAQEIPLAGALAGARINALQADAANLWIASTTGLWRLSAGAEHPVPVALPGEGQKEVLALTIDADGNLWASTSSALVRFQGTEFADWIGTDELHGMGRLISAYADASGGLWFGSQAQGVMRMWQGGVEQLGQRDGLGDTSTWVLEPQGDGFIVGTNDGVWVFADNRFSRLIEGAALPNPAVYSLLRTRDDRLFVGTRGGLARFSDGSSKPFPYADLASLQIHSLLEEPGRGVWAATQGGLYLISDDAATHQPLSSAGLASPRVRSLLLDRAGTLWAGTETGLSKRDPDGQFSEVSDDGPYRAFVTTLHELPDGRLIAGTYDKGLYVRNARGWRQLTPQEGLPSSSVFSIGIAGQSLIISHLDGVYELPVAQLDSDRLRPRVLFEDLGRIPDRARLRCCNGGGNGRGLVSATRARAWFPTLAGVLQVHLDSAPRLPPKTVLRQLSQGGRSLALAPEVRLQPGSRDLTISYAAVEVAMAERLRYRYRLRQLDRQWTDAGRRREAYFTHLPAGLFTFEVQARLDHEPWGPKEQISLTVPATMTERWPFRLGFLGLALLCGAGLLRWREHSSRARQAMLEELIAARTEELSKANERLAIANEALAEASVTDPLTGLHNRRFILEQIGSIVANLRRNRVRSGEDRVIGVCIIDVDRFKRVNDDYGHDIGDRVLKRVATALRREMRDGDYLLRWGGEEFVVITNESQRGSLAPIAERFRSAVESSGGSGGEPGRVTISVGYAAYPLPGRSIEDHDWLSALNLADQALLGAKSAGRNRIATVEIEASAWADLDAQHLSAAKLEELYESGAARLVTDC